MKGKDIPVFNSVDVRDAELYREDNETAAMWLIDKYTLVVFELRPIVEKKQKIRFNINDDYKRYHLICYFSYFAKRRLLDERLFNK